MPKPTLPENFLIEEGLSDYEEEKNELKILYEQEKTENPLTKEKFNQEIARFIDENLEKFISIVINDPPADEIIKELNLDNEFLTLMETNYTIEQEDNGKFTIYKWEDEYKNYSVSVAEFFALAYLKKHIKTIYAIDIYAIDIMERTDAKLPPKRFFLNSQNRYLCKNDFGMNIWDEVEQRMIQGEINDITPFLNTIKIRIQHIIENLDVLTNQIYDNFERNDSDQNGEETKEQLLTSKILEHLLKNPKDRELILTALPQRKFMRYCSKEFPNLIRKYNTLGNGKKLFDSYETFINNYNIKDVKKIFYREPSEKEKENTSINFIYSKYTSQPIIISPTNLNYTIRTLIQDIKNWLINIDIQKEDENIKNLFFTHQPSPSLYSFHFYDDYELYDFIKTLGYEKASNLLKDDEYTTSERMTDLVGHIGYTFLAIM